MLSMTPKRQKQLQYLLGIALLIPVFMLAYQRITLDQRKISFTSATGSILRGRYYPGEQPAGVILLSGLGSDQVNMTSMLVEFQTAGFHVFSFDFTGHGISGGTLGLDHTQTDVQAQQLLTAIEQFKTASNLSEEQIVLVGHSLGARVALQTAGSTSQSLAGLVLLGTQVNLSPNVKPEFLTGTIDNTLSWIQQLGPDHPNVNIALFSGSWDDILTPDAAGLLAAKLTGTTTAPPEISGNIADNSLRAYRIYDRVLHNYEVFEPGIITDTVQLAMRMTGSFSEPETFSQRYAALRVQAWLMGLTGIFLLLISTLHDLPAPKPARLLIKSSDPKKFLLAKLLFWLPALPLGALLAAVFFLIPIGFPAFNMIYVAFLGSYGILMLLLYRRGRMPGMVGRLPFDKPKRPPRRKTMVWTLLAGLALLIFTAAYAHSGWFYVYPLNARLIWLLLFTPVTALVFWVGHKENAILAGTKSVQPIHKLLLRLIRLLPFFIWALILAGLGSLSGLTVSVHGLIILALVIISGELFQKLGQRAWLTALLQAFLLYWLILPQGVLF